MKWKVLAAVALLVPLLFIALLAMLSATSRRPKLLGVREGRLAPCPDSPNCVSTQAEREHHRMEPLPMTENSAEVIARLRAVIAAMPRTKIVTSDDDYLHVEFTSPIFRFVDDVEFFVDPEAKQIHFRSASRVGRSDLGVNRRRMQAIVAAHGAASPAHDDLPKTDR